MKSRLDQAVARGRPSERHGGESFRIRTVEQDDGAPVLGERRGRDRERAGERACQLVDLEVWPRFFSILAAQSVGNGRGGDCGFGSSLGRGLSGRDSGCFGGLLCLLGRAPQRGTEERFER